MTQQNPGLHSTMSWASKLVSGRLGLLLSRELVIRVKLPVLEASQLRAEREAKREANQDSGLAKPH